MARSKKGRGRKPPNPPTEPPDPSIGDAPTSDAPTIPPDLPPPSRSGEAADVPPGYGKMIDITARRNRLNGWIDLHNDPRYQRDDDPANISRTTLNDRFQIGICIGRGGMGYVYFAYDVRCKRDCVVKISADASCSRRFEREAQCHFLLENIPGVPRLYDEGRLPDGRAFIAMQMIKGQTLSEYLGTLPVAEGAPLMPWQDAIALGLKINTVLSAIHRAGILHRDLKPKNIMISTEGEVFIIDFGMAWYGGAERLTEPDIGFGTEGFQSPEQRLGMVFELDQRTDIYSVSMIIRLMLGGPLAVPLGATEKSWSKPRVRRRKPKNHVEDKLLRAIAFQRPLRALIPTMPGALADEVQRAGAAAPDDRFDTVDEFSDAMRPCIELAEAAEAVEPAAAAVKPAAAVEPAAAAVEPAAAVELAAAVAVPAAVVEPVANSVEPAAVAARTAVIESVAPMANSADAASARRWQARRMMVVSVGVLFGAAMVFFVLWLRQPVRPFAAHPVETVRPVEPARSVERARSVEPARVATQPPRPEAPRVARRALLRREPSGGLIELKEEESER